jgi:DNA-binding transcriptional MerR regulator
MTSADVIDRDFESYLSCPELCRMAGISYRQIDYWSRVGLVAAAQEAAGSGSQRLFEPEAVGQVRVVALLVRMALDHDEIRATVDMMGRAETIEGMTIEPFPGVTVDLAAVAASPPAPRPKTEPRMPPQEPRRLMSRPRW